MMVWRGVRRAGGCLCGRGWMCVKVRRDVRGHFVACGGGTGGELWKLGEGGGKRCAWEAGGWEGD